MDQHANQAENRAENQTKIQAENQVSGQRPTRGRQRWTEADIPDQAGRTALVTGASAGLGLRVASVLAARGAHVVLACRDLERAARAVRQITAQAPDATTSVVRLDLAAQSSVRAAAAEIRDRCDRLDLLLNNAGVMQPTERRTDDGFELSIAVNHLGPFALTGLLLDRLASGARVVTMSSLAHLRGVMNFDDLMSERGYDANHVYGQSKLANLLFSYELDRRLRAAGIDATALAAHPGVVYTDLFAGQSRWERILLSPAMRPINFWAVQDVRLGALPMLRAATDPAARGGEYYGPRRYGLRSWFYTGYPAIVASNDRSHDSADQARLWAESERLTGVAYLAV